MESRVYNAKRNILWGTIEKIVTLFLPFITRTLIIKLLGEEYLGLGSLFSSIIQVLNLSELGFGSAMVFHMYKLVALNDDQAMCALLNYYKKIYRVIGALVLVFGMAAMPFLEFLIAGNVPADVSIYVLYLIYLATTVTSYWLYAYKNSVLYAMQRTDIQSNVNSFIQILVFLFQILLLIIFKNYYLYVIWILISRITNNIITAIIVKKKFPQYLCEGELNLETRLSIKIKLRALIGHKLGGVILNAADNIVISAFLGLTILARFSNYRYLDSAVAGLLIIIYNSIAAGVGNSIAKENIDKNYNDFNKFSFLNIWIIGWCSICFLCLYQPFITFWIGEQYLFPTNTMLLFVIYFAVSHLRKIVLSYKDAAGLWEVDALKPYIESVTKLVFNLILVQWIGVNGVLLSSILIMALIDIPWEVYALFRAYFITKSIREYFTMLFKYVLFFLGAGALTFYMSSIVTVSGFGGLLLIGSLCLVIPNILFIMLFSNHQLFKEGTSFLLRAIKIKNS